MRMMSPDRALIRARTIWGKKGYVERKRGKEPGTAVCRVGKLDGIGDMLFFAVEGSGPSFEAAFAAFEAKEKRDRIGWHDHQLYEAVKKCRDFIREQLLDGARVPVMDGNPGDLAAALDNELTALIDEIEGGA